VGSRARLGNGPAYRPRASLRTLSQDAVPQAPFFHSSRITVRPYSFCFRLSFLLSLFRAPATQRHPPPSNATRHFHSFQPPPAANASSAAAPSEHTATHAQLPPPSTLFRLAPRAHASRLSFLPFRLRLAAPPPSRAVNATKHPPRRRRLAMRTKDTKPLENRHGLACFVDNSGSRCITSLISSFLSSLTLPNRRSLV